MKNTIKLHIWSDTDLRACLYNIHDKNAHIIVYAAEEFEIGNFDAEKMKTRNIDWIFGRSQPQTAEKTDCVGRLHLWWNFFLFKAGETIEFSHLKFNSYSEKKFITLNYKGHSHRCLLMDLIYKKNMQGDGYISWHNIDLDEHYKFRWFTPESLKLNDNFAEQCIQNILPSEYSLALVNLISESDTDNIFITEKTWHAILYGKCFLAQAARGFHHFLEQQGFELYNEIFDYAFDKEENLHKRTSMLLDEIKKIDNKNLDRIHSEIYPKIQRNKQLALRMIKNQTGVPPICQDFKYYHTIIKEAQCRLVL